MRSLQRSHSLCLRCFSALTRLPWPRHSSRGWLPSVMHIYERAEEGGEGQSREERRRRPQGENREIGDHAEGWARHFPGKRWPSAKMPDFCEIRCPTREKRISWKSLSLPSFFHLSPSLCSLPFTTALCNPLWKEWRSLTLSLSVCPSLTALMQRLINILKEINKWNDFTTVKYFTPSWDNWSAAMKTTKKEQTQVHRQTPAVLSPAVTSWNNVVDLVDEPGSDHHYLQSA